MTDASPYLLHSRAPLIEKTPGGRLRLTENVKGGIFDMTGKLQGVLLTDSLISSIIFRNGMTILYKKGKKEASLAFIPEKEAENFSKCLGIFVAGRQLCP